MNTIKGFATSIVLMIVLGIIVLGGAGYVAMNPEVLQKAETTYQDEVQTDLSVDGKTTILWSFTGAGEVDAIPYTDVTVVINGNTYAMGKFAGSCSEVGATGGVDGKGLLTGEIAATQCWFAGGGNEIGVFGHEDGGVEVMVGELSEGEEGAGLFRGDFDIKHTVRF